MKKKVFLMTLLLLLISAFYVHANTATVIGKNASIVLNEASGIMGVDPVTFLFTTYDGSRYSIPYYYDDYNGIIYYSSELKKVGSRYKTDYFGLSGFVIFDYGELSFNLPTTDQNGNGLDDICEIDKSVNTTITGNWYSSDGTSGIISANFIRSVNSKQGSYSATIYNTFAGTVQLSGTWNVGIMDGSIDYENGGGSITVSYISDFGDPSPVDTLSSTYEIIDQDTILVNAKDEFPTSNFIRNGNTYSAMVTLIDGGLDTFWPDYQKWYYIIVDDNDIDGDGIPDLSDKTDNRIFTIIASALDDNGYVEPESVEVGIGKSQTFIAYPNTGYRVKEWEVNGLVVQSSGRQFTLTNIQDDAEVTVSFLRVKPMTWLPLLLDD